MRPPPPEGAIAATEPQRLDLHVAARATRQDVARVETSLLKGIAAAESRMQAFVWKVVVGTAVVLSVATVGTMLAGYAALSNSMQQLFMMIERT